MKLWIKGFLISGLLLSSTLIQARPVMSSFSTEKRLKIHVDDLSFKNIMSTFYVNKMTKTLLNDYDKKLNKLPHIGLGGFNNEGYQQVAVMHPVMTYKSPAGEPRFLVLIEKIKVDRNGQLNGCHACYADADFYSFKRVPKGYELVSKSKPNARYFGSWGRINFSRADFEKNQQLLGKNISGSFLKNSYSSMGTIESIWEAVHLPENNYITLYLVGDAGESNLNRHDNGSPLSEEYDSSITVHQNGAEFFPVKVHYKGDKEIKGTIQKINQVQTFIFNPKKKAIPT